MISSLRGRVISVGKDTLVLETNGVGFCVHVPAGHLEQACRVGEETRLFTHLHVRENELTLYGFVDEESLSLFELLMTAPGIGPRAALSLLSGLTPETLRNAIAHEDSATLTTIPGIGPKTARNLVFHLRDKVQAATLPSARAGVAPADTDVVAALTALGYSVAEAQRAVQTLPRDVAELEERIRLALVACGRT